MQAGAARGPLPRNIPPFAASSRQYVIEKRRNGGKSFVSLLEHPGKEIETVRHAFADEMLDPPAAGRPQLLGEDAVLVDERILRAGRDQRGRIAAQVGARRTGMRMSPVLAVDEIGAADEADEGGVVDDPERPEPLER